MGEQGYHTEARLQSGWMRFLCSVKTNLQQKKWDPVIQTLRHSGVEILVRSKLDMIVNDNVELIEDCIAHKDYKTAQEHLRTLKATVHTLSQVDIKRAENKNHRLFLLHYAKELPVIFIIGSMERAV